MGNGVRSRAALKGGPEKSRVGFVRRRIQFNYSLKPPFSRAATNFESGGAHLYGLATGSGK